MIKYHAARRRTVMIARAHRVTTPATTRQGNGGEWTTGTFTLDPTYTSGQEGKGTLSRLEMRLIGLLQAGAMTRDQMVQKLGIPRTTIYDGLRRLIQMNIVMRYPVPTLKRSKGRPRILFSLVDVDAD